MAQSSLTTNQLPNPEFRGTTGAVALFSDDFEGSDPAALRK
ncbi:MAG: hypothetical protein AB8B96_14355 [Lysobacterales bacterium]